MTRAALLATAFVIALPTSAFADTPIPGARAWTLVNDEAGCWAERNSDIHVKILANKNGFPVLAVAHPDFKTNDTGVDFTLQIDGGPAVRSHGSGVANIVLIGFDDDRGAAVLKATSLDWHMPWGNYHADVTGIGTAFAAVTACQSKHR